MDEIALNERKYVAISIKHSIYDKSKRPILWGYKRTAGSEKRCFSDYTSDISKCELYCLNDFLKHYGNNYIKCDKAVRMCIDYKKQYKKYDTVLVDIEEVSQFLKMC